MVLGFFLLLLDGVGLLLGRLLLVLALLVVKVGETLEEAEGRREDSLELC